MQAKMTDQEFLDARNDGLSYQAIADKFGLNKRTVERRAQRLNQEGRINSVGVPGFMVERETVHIRDGSEVQRWIRTRKDEPLFEDIIAAMQGEIPKAEPKVFGGVRNSDTLALYPVFDAHIGMVAHKHECGQNYDTKIAEELFASYINYAAEHGSYAGKAVLLIGGDFLHSDGMLPVTPTSGHVLDQDSRYHKLVHVAVRSVRRAVDILLSKHEFVELQIIPGNHDQSGLIWLRAAMALHYENEPRVTVDVSPRAMHATAFGNVLLGYCHGHDFRKPEIRLECLARDFRSDFGKCEYIYTHSGHLHSSKVVETRLGIDEVHGQLAAPDAYAVNNGWRSNRQAAVITYHREFGEVGRFWVRPAML